jgi:hypothetical protein
MTIGSVIEMRDQLMAQMRRREEVAAQQAVQAAPAVAAPVAGGIPAGGYAPATALKGAEPDVSKRRKGKGGKPGRALEGRDLASDPLTDAHEAAEAGDGEHSRKSYADRGVHAGPGDGVMPGHPAPESFDRGYLEAGHGAESPQAEPPRQSPFMHALQGYPQSIAVSSQTLAADIPHHVASAYSMGSPSDR